MIWMLTNEHVNVGSGVQKCKALFEELECLAQALKFKSPVVCFVASCFPVCVLI